MHASYRCAAIALLLFSCASPATPARCPEPARAPEPLTAPARKETSETKAATPEGALARLFTETKIDAAWFTKDFVAAVPPAKIQAIVADITAELGALTKVEKAADGYAIVLAKGKVPAKVKLDAEGRIDSLWFSPPETTSAMSLAETEAQLRALPGKVSYLVLSDGSAVAQGDADAPMAVGSAFKLAILEALREKIDAKKAKWTDVVRLEDRHRSLPSGSLHTWPAAAPITLHSIAALMISVSDNTATDLLLDYVGRGAVEKIAPANAPFMSTRDAFVLKSKANAPLQARWRSADATARRAMLAELAATKLADDEKMEEAPSIDVEWMLSARQLCDLLAKTKALDVTRINPGVAKKKEWDLVAYKGGSEPGVLNLSSWVEKAGKKHCVVTTWNDPEKDVQSGKLLALHAALLGALR